MSVLQQHGGTRVLQLFCSYAREDREGVRALLDGVRHLRHQVWVDERLSGGQAWWDEILAQLRKCDAMLIAVSPALLESQASALERQSRRLGGTPRAARLDSLAARSGGRLKLGGADAVEAVGREARYREFRAHAALRRQRVGEGDPADLLRQAVGDQLVEKGFGARS